ncbi:hypothetical protein QBC37DRAFT_107572 [Rhypophila decipiens]|uniref:Uncharacterized protein n=1 Tax=Rhypophila decipiens TaxID=261697 RepID=A0AAN7B0Y4_9PEZI|nr:hypothetical protein QBC37DRAFT_107572 [Rhypophila decipiens]
MCFVLCGVQLSDGALKPDLDIRVRRNDNLPHQKVRIMDPFQKNRQLPYVKWIDDETAEVPAKRVTCGQLRRYLESTVPGRYAVQLERDLFRITILPATSLALPH